MSSKSIRHLAVPISLAALIATIVPLIWTRPVPQRIGGSNSDEMLGFRMVFGELQERAADYSGSLALSAGKVVRLAPWRFLRQDAIEGTTGWKVQIKRIGFENQPDRPVPIMVNRASQNLVPEGVEVTVKAPFSATAHVRTAQGSFDVPLQELRQGRKLQFLGGDVEVERTPVAEKVTEPVDQSAPEQHDYPDFAVTRQGTVWVAWQAYRANGDEVYARHSVGGGWSQVFRLTERKGDIFRTAVAADTAGRVWVIWSERTNENWDLYARVYDGNSWGARRKLTSGDSPNLYHRLVAAPDGTLHLIWIAYREGQSHAHWSKLRGDTWSQPVEISGDGAWAPDAAADSHGNLYVAWDSYRTGNYDIFLRKIGADGSMGPVQQVTTSTLFQAHPAVTVDRQDRVWLAWDESGMNWGKDWSHEDSWRGTPLYLDRRPRIAVLEGNAWKQPAADIMAAVPRRFNRYIEQPRIACDAAGRLWVSFEIRTASSTNLSEGEANGGRWERFLTSLEGGHWTPLMPVPETSTRPEGALQMKPSLRGVRMCWTNIDTEIPKLHEIFATSFNSSTPPVPPQLEEFTDSSGRDQPVHTAEAADVARVRAYRIAGASGELRILRGDFHRHTEISGDGAGDGSLDDYSRYMLDAAQMDTGIISDHNAGNDNEYTWWRTEKAIDLYHIQKRFTPLFGYERSVSYPNGHRNVVFAQRGTRTLPISGAEKKGQLNSGPLLYPYLRQNRGICMLHSLATNQGTDFRDNDPELEPLVEIYQGYHASYEYEGAPRAESESYMLSPPHGSLRPLGFYWNALDKGYKLGVQSSSDHISTHCSYTMIYSPSDRRSDIVESIRQRHVYGATDNIILDFQAIDAQGKPHLMGDAFEAAAAPKLVVRIAGTARIAAVDIVKNKTFIYHAEPGSDRTEFTYVDSHPDKGESYYYVRAVQIDRNMAWSSPIWVKYK